MLALHSPRTGSHRGSRRPHTRRSLHGVPFRRGGLYIDRGATGAVVMAWDVAQREGHEWVPLDDAELQDWLARLPPYAEGNRAA